MDIQKLKSFTRQQWLPIAGFLGSFCLAISFAFTFLADAIHFNNSENRDIALEGWMTPKYVMLSYDLPRPIVLEALGIKPIPNSRPQRMLEIAENLDLTLEELTQRIRVTASVYRAQSE